MIETNKLQRSSEPVNVDYFDTLTINAKKLQFLYYLFSLYQAILVVITTLSTLIISLLLVTNRSACLLKPINQSINIRQLYLVDMSVKLIWLIAHIILLIFFISQQNRRIQRLTEIMSIINIILFGLKFTFGVVMTIQTLGTDMLNKCDQYAKALFIFIEVLKFLGIFLGSLNIVYLYRHSQNIVQQLTDFRKERTHNHRLVQVYYGKSLMSQGRNTKQA